MTKIEPGMIAVVTGGGAGMGRQLCVQLCRMGVRVSTCDVNEAKLSETAAECNEASHDADIFTYRCDVSCESECIAFKEAVLLHFSTSHINLLFNNAGISGGGSFVAGSRAEWDACFGVCWFGVYFMSRAFVPTLVASTRGHIVNTSSVNGFWATVGRPHTAYSAAKFAVKGFTEALIGDMRQHAPHVGVSLICPGHIGTDIALNSLQSMTQGERGAAHLEGLRKAVLADPHAPEAFKEHVRSADRQQMLGVVQIMGEQFRDTGMTASDAAKYILNAVQAGQWRVLVGKDAEALDEAVRADPTAAYEPEFFRAMGKTWTAINNGQGGNSNLAKQQKQLGLVEHPGQPAAKL